MGYKFRSVILALSIASISSFGAHAQEAVLVNGVQATRVVIGPAVSPMAKIIKAGLRDDYYGAKSGTRAWKNAQGLYYFYGARSFEPMWLQNNGDQVTFSPKAQEIVELFKKAEFEGLRTSDYLTDQLDIDAAQGDPQMLAHVEVAFTDAAILYAKHAAGGRIAPSAVSSAITLHPTRVDLAKLRVDLVSSDNPAALLQSMHPTHKEFSALRAELAKRIAGPKIEQIIVPDGKLMKLGKTDERLPVLRERLGLTLDDPANEFIYDQFAEDAIKDFQTSIGLIADGVVGPATIAALNGAHGASAQDIVANMERWRWMPKNLGDFHVFVNIPEFKLQVVKSDKVEHATRVVVGKPKHMTPVFSDEIEHVVVNPYWNVPSSIATTELLPSANGNPGYFDSRNYELLAGGKVINASSVDWANINPKNPPFRIRQRPGSGNALGTIKFLFPNQHSVYLHDTPSKSLFSRTYRAYSHGCVRVHNPLEFADALLRYEPSLNLSQIKGMMGGNEKWNNLKTHVPVHLAYFTLRVDPDGTVRSFGDVYGHHKKLVDLLNS
ncbi:L,D-transpeptidase family protein [uncultured Maritalea sp.]|jgi:murein L,D-transpeptidase YcbB/YkuD|uniref:L,D-transpeptidase family protein n=1 Tax=uncultured Maritalea sp. TaxID=757249 RepID=UPI00261159DD|nr:L,D-transpeptidase family protein [uncultured Maritalea sp.]